MARRDAPTRDDIAAVSAAKWIHGRREKYRSRRGKRVILGPVDAVPPPGVVYTALCANNSGSV